MLTEEQARSTADTTQEKIQAVLDSLYMPEEAEQLMQLINDPCANVSDVQEFIINH